MKKFDFKFLEISLIPNTDMKISLFDGVEKSYYITPKEGFKLHAKELDFKDDMTGEIVLGFTEGLKTCGIDYDFLLNPREFYAVEIEKESEG